MHMFLIILFAIVQNNFVQDVHSFSMENNLQNLSSMCDKAIEDVEQIILRIQNYFADNDDDVKAMMS